KSLFRAFIAIICDIDGFVSIIQIWNWEIFLHFHPTRRMPLVLKGEDAHDNKTLLLYEKRCMRFVWMSHVAILHALLPCFTADQGVWIAVVPMIYLDIMEEYIPGLETLQKAEEVRRIDELHVPAVLAPAPTPDPELSTSTHPFLDMPRSFSQSSQDAYIPVHDDMDWAALHRDLKG
ncbi:hypothetical protein HAX54_033495, partial [Datura stramonium]|nr:hypothetical protein [Datura stramonium]